MGVKAKESFRLFVSVETFSDEFPCHFLNLIFGYRCFEEQKLVLWFSII